jgi:hypothetical protein
MSCTQVGVWRTIEMAGWKPQESLALDAARVVGHHAGLRYGLIVTGLLDHRTRRELLPGPDTDWQF